MPSTFPTTASCDDFEGNEGPAEDTFTDEGIPTIMSSVRDQMLSRRDSLFSVKSTYVDPSDNDLSVWQAATLLLADCMGTGLLALPEDIKVLGRWVGLGFLVMNLPINLYAGTILSDAAAHVERTQNEENAAYEQRQNEVKEMQLIHEELEEELPASSKDALRVESPKKNRGHRNKEYASVGQSDDTESDVSSCIAVGHTNDEDLQIQDQGMVDRTPPSAPAVNTQQKVHHDTATFDFVGMTQAMFFSRRTTQIVLLLYYTNIFLVLGDYILVMSHAVSAMVGEERICIPKAGALAATLMYGVAQIKTMVRASICFVLS
jgi:Transmembrane amino acid transporter protein